MAPARIGPFLIQQSRYLTGLYLPSWFRVAERGDLRDRLGRSRLMRVNVMRNAPERPITVESPGLYTIVVQGNLDPGWSDRLGGMQVTLGISDDSVSQLTGWLIDQTALHGVLSTLHGLSLPILSVDRVR